MWNKAYELLNQLTKFKFVFKISNENYADAKKWCTDEFEADPTRWDSARLISGTASFYFMNEDDAIRFSLTWT
jgi:hypothetical protein